VTNSEFNIKTVEVDYYLTTFEVVKTTIVLIKA